MTIAELKTKYTKHELSYFPGDNELRYQAFSPLFSNLFESKVIYHERLTLIVKLENILITPERFEATAIPHIMLSQRNPYPKTFLAKPWQFGGVWSWTTFSGNSLGGPYGGWTIWTNPETVKLAEQYVMEGEFQKAIRLTFDEPSLKREHPSLSENNSNK